MWLILAIIIIERTIYLLLILEMLLLAVSSFWFLLFLFKIIPQWMNTFDLVFFSFFQLKKTDMRSQCTFVMNIFFISFSEREKMMSNCQKQIKHENNILWAFFQNENDNRLICTCLRCIFKQYHIEKSFLLVHWFDKLNHNNNNIKNKSRENCFELSVGFGHNNRTAELWT